MWDIHFPLEYVWHLNGPVPACLTDGEWLQSGVPALEYGPVSPPLQLTRDGGGASQHFLLDDDGLLDELGQDKERAGPEVDSPPPRNETRAEVQSGERGSGHDGRSGSNRGLDHSRSFKGWVSP
jgi:hypothetical protein